MLAASLMVLLMEAASTSEASVNFYQTTLRNNPEDSHLRLKFVWTSRSIHVLEKLPIMQGFEENKFTTGDGPTEEEALGFL
jgi:hypothetical protein